MDVRQIAFDWLSNSYSSLHHFDLDYYSQLLAGLWKRSGYRGNQFDCETSVMCWVTQADVIDFVDSIYQPGYPEPRPYRRYVELAAHVYWMFCLQCYSRLNP
jgi:hypothetical protein